MQHTQYISTRGQMATAEFTECSSAGLAPDGGSRYRAVRPEPRADRGLATPGIRDSGLLRSLGLRSPPTFPGGPGRADPGRPMARSGSHSRSSLVTGLDDRRRPDPRGPVRGADDGLRATWPCSSGRRLMSWLSTTGSSSWGATSMTIRFGGPSIFQGQEWSSCSHRPAA